MAAARPARPHLDHATGVPGAEVRLWSHGTGTYAGAPGAHATLELAWVEQGSVSYRIGARQFVVEAGEAFFVPRGVEHVTTFDTPAIAGAIALDAEMIAELSESLGGRALPEEAGKLAGSTRMSTLGQLIRAEISAKESGYLMSVDALTEAMAIAMMRATTSPPRGSTSRDARVVAVLDLIHGNYADQLAIDDLARAAGVSRFHMSRLFRDAVGQSPYQYLVRTRVEHAAQLLRSGRRSVTEVAFAVGFADLGRFARTFRALIGKSPGSYAKRPHDTRSGVG